MMMSMLETYRKNNEARHKDIYIQYKISFIYIFI